MKHESFNDGDFNLDNEQLGFCIFLNKFFISKVLHVIKLLISLIALDTLVNHETKYCLTWCRHDR